VDCGAFDGDTLLNFQKWNIPLEAVSAFEPDGNNFQKLVQTVHANRSYYSHISLWPCGVSHTTCQLTFDTGQGEASSVSLGGNSIIQCVSLDDAIPDFMPTLIKMDIEGAEPDALRGARNLIKNSRPGLAISIYHRPEHLWQIPLILEDLAKGQYRYFLRAHAFNDFDIVLYAIPN
jgi:FkbM family methyltransferase